LIISRAKIHHDVLSVLDKLNGLGFQAYLVGGAVRDLIMFGECRGDWDIATNARPFQVIQAFHEYNVVPTGIKHGTVTVQMHIPIEITTFRKEGVYSDNRRPDHVTFVNSLQEDLGRRDFTFNAMAMDSTGYIFDYFHGDYSIFDETVYPVGDPLERFSEDYLRMMRAIRFSSQFDFYLSDAIEEAIPKIARNIVKVSPERIRDEFNKILLSEYPSHGLYHLQDLGLLKHIIPELDACAGFNQCNPKHNRNVFDHSIAVSMRMKPTIPLRLAGLLHDVGKPQCFSLDVNGVGHFYAHHLVSLDMTRDILTRLKYDNKTIDKVCTLVKYHMARYEVLRPNSLKKFINKVGKENIDELFELMESDIYASASLKSLPDLMAFKNATNDILLACDPLSVKDLAVNGLDVMGWLNISPGPAVGSVLDTLLEMVLEDPSLNTRKALKSIVMVYFVVARTVGITGA
jgi:tRNA nucleotidyltransferase (CCA-adding enzyme)